MVTASRRDWQEVFTLLGPAHRAAGLAALSPEQTRLWLPLHPLWQAQADISSSDFLRTPPSFVFAQPPASAALVAQALVGSYRLLHEIGQGGMASVWLADRADGLRDRHIALKLPHPGRGDAPFMPFTDRMARERRRRSRIRTSRGSATPAWLWVG